MNLLASGSFARRVPRDWAKAFGAQSLVLVLRCGSGDAALADTAFGGCRRRRTLRNGSVNHKRAAPSACNCLAGGVEVMRRAPTQLDGVSVDATARGRARA
jgi:hypothetical protein